MANKYLTMVHEEFVYFFLLFKISEIFLTHFPRGPTLPRVAQLTPAFPPYIQILLYKKYIQFYVNKYGPFSQECRCRACRGMIFLEIRFPHHGCALELTG